MLETYRRIEDSPNLQLYNLTQWMEQRITSENCYPYVGPITLLNSNINDYPLVGVQFESADWNNSTITYHFSIYYMEVVTPDVKPEEIQSRGIVTLLRMFDSVSSNVTFTPFIQEFSDITTGVVMDCYIEEGINLCYEPEPYDKKKDYLTLESDKDSKFSCRQMGDYWPVIEYRIVNKRDRKIVTNWTEYQYDDVDVKKEYCIQFRGSGPIHTTQYDGVSSFCLSEPFIAYGNPLSLIHGDNYAEATTVPERGFYELFRNTHITDASDLNLSATELSRLCYARMFSDCNYLIEIPELPATTLAKQCYQNMFSFCISITKAPELPATTLDEHCYSFMFYECYQINYIKVYAENWPIQRGFGLIGTETGTFYKKAGVDIPVGEDGIPEGWTVIEF